MFPLFRCLLSDPHCINLPSTSITYKWLFFWISNVQFLDHHYNYLLVDLESDLIDESRFLSKTRKLLHIEIQVRIFGIFEQVKPIINNSLKNRRIKLLFACSTHCKFGKLSNGFHSCLAVPQAVNGPGVGLLGLLGVGAELLATFECPLCGTEQIFDAQFLQLKICYRRN